jgi:hypothetical protein
MARLRFSLFLALAAALSASALYAQSALSAESPHFTINQGNHAIGRSDFSIQPVKQGPIVTPAAYSVTSHGTLSLQNTKYSFSASGSLDSNLAILQENLNGIVNGAAVTVAVRPVAGNFAIDISANGKSYHNSLNRPAQTAFLPDFDLAGYAILLDLATRHPGTQIWVLIPKQTGILSATTLAPQADVQGTLNSKAMTVHHSSLTIGSVVTELYFSAANSLLEVDIPSQTFAVVRENFQLQPPPPPPPEAAPNSQQPNSAAPTQP